MQNNVHGAPKVSRNDGMHSSFPGNPSLYGALCSLFVQSRLLMNEIYVRETNILIEYINMGTN
jgi:hypothetical protein